MKKVLLSILLIFTLCLISCSSDKGKEELWDDLGGGMGPGGGRPPKH